MTSIPREKIVLMRLGAILRVRFNNIRVNDLVAHLAERHLIEHHAVIPVRPISGREVFDSFGCRVRKPVHLVVNSSKPNGNGQQESGHLAREVRLLQFRSGIRVLVRRVSSPCNFLVCVEQADQAVGIKLDRIAVKRVRRQRDHELWGPTNDRDFPVPSRPAAVGNRCHDGVAILIIHSEGEVLWLS